MLKRLIAVTIVGALLFTQTCVWAAESGSVENKSAADKEVTKHSSNDITKGDGFDVYNQTPYELQFKLNGSPFGGTSPAGKYGTITASWFVIKLGCFFHEICPVEIIWKTPEKDTILKTTINTKTGVIGADTSLDANLPSLNAEITKEKIPLKVTLSNEDGASSGYAKRNGYELVTVTPK